MFRTLAIAAFVLAALVLSPGAGTASEIVTVGLDMEVSGNGPRSAADIDQCVSVAPGQPVTVDVATTEPGVPAAGGVAAYQFTLFFDRSIVSVTGDDHKMLLDQAPGSALIPLAGSRPDTDGIYTSGAVDFGPKGIEPVGASEKGPGVLARLTLTPHAAGVSPLVIKDVIIKDDAGKDIEIISILSAHLYSGQPCPGQAVATPTPRQSPSPSPAPATARPQGTPPAGGTPRPGGLGQAGGPPGSRSDGMSVPMVAGAALTLAGAALALEATRRRL